MNMIRHAIRLGTLCVLLSVPAIGTAGIIVIDFSAIPSGPFAGPAIEDGAQLSTFSGRFP